MIVCTYQSEIAIPSLMQMVATLGLILNSVLDDVNDILKMKHSRSGSSTLSEMMGTLMHWLEADCESWKVPL